MRSSEPIVKTVILILSMVVVLCLCSCFSAPRERIQADSPSAVPDSDALLAPKNVHVSKNTSLVAETESGPLRVSLEDAILMAMQNNPSIIVEQFNPDIQTTFVGEDEAMFDPMLSAEISAQRNDRSSSDTNSSTTDIYRGSLSLKEIFPLGTFMGAEISSSLTDDNQYSDPSASTRLGLSITQPLLRGYGKDANLAKIRQSRLNTAISRYELRAFTEALLARVESAY